MTYGELSSIVQLGVGLHLGTALLQLYGELGVQPLLRTFERIKMLFSEEESRPPQTLKEELVGIESDFNIFKIQLFNEYRKYVVINSAMAVLLVFMLVVITYRWNDIIPVELSVFAVAASVLVAPVTLCVLWTDASRALKPIKRRADDLESRALRVG